MSKDKLERKYLDAFALALGHFPLGRIEKFEHPDFLVHRESTVLGIELTRLFHQPTAPRFLLREQESLRHHVANVAKHSYDSKNGPPIHVTIFFNDQVPVRKARLNSLADSVAAIALRMASAADALQEESFNWTNRAYFPEEIATIRARRFDGITISFFGPTAGAWLPFLSVTDLQLEFQKKEDHIARYLHSCNELWLVMCYKAEGLASVVEVSDATASATYRTSFDRAFLFAWPDVVRSLAVST